MSSKTIKRPAVRARNWAWKDRDRNETPGIALWGRKGLTAHLTYTEARTLADALHDLADAAATTASTLPATPGRTGVTQP